MTPEQSRHQRFLALRHAQECAAASRAVTTEARERRLRLAASFERQVHALAATTSEPSS